MKPIFEQIKLLGNLTAPFMDLRIVIVDDEPNTRSTIRKLLTQYCDGIAVVAEAGSVQEALTVLFKFPIDLLLLDVEMEDGTGFDLLDRLPQINFNVAFVTAHDDFAIKAFRYNAIDYLLKPVDPDELAAMVQKAKDSTNYETLRKQISQLIHAANEKTFDRIALNTTAGVIFAATKDIARVESYGNYSFVFTRDGDRHLVSRNLKEFEEILPAPEFFRPHQSHLINTALVKKFDKEDGGQAILLDGTKIPVSRRRRIAFLEILGDSGFDSPEEE